MASISLHLLIATHSCQLPCLGGLSEENKFCLVVSSCTELGYVLIGCGKILKREQWSSLAWHIGDVSFNILILKVELVLPPSESSYNFRTLNYISECNPSYWCNRAWIMAQVDA